MAQRSQSQPLGWKTISRILGLTIVITILVVYVFAFFARVPMDTVVGLALLGVGSALLGIPGAWQIVRSNGSTGGSRSGRDG